MRYIYTCFTRLVHILGRDTNGQCTICKSDIFYFKWFCGKGRTIICSVLLCGVTLSWITRLKARGEAGSDVSRDTDSLHWKQRVILSLMKPMVTLIWQARQTPIAAIMSSLSANETDILFWASHWSIPPFRESKVNGLPKPGSADTSGPLLRVLRWNMVVLGPQTAFPPFGILLQLYQSEWAGRMAISAWIMILLIQVIHPENTTRSVN